MPSTVMLSDSSDGSTPAIAAAGTASALPTATGRLQKVSGRRGQQAKRSRALSAASARPSRMPPNPAYR